MEERQAKFINGYDHGEDKPGGAESDSCEDEDDDSYEQEVGIVKGNVT